MRKRTPARRKSVKKRNPYIKVAIISFIVLFLFAIGYHYRDGLAYYLGFKTDKILRKEAADKRLSDVRNMQVLVRHEGKVIGCDVSEYQGTINWKQVDSIGLYPIGFAFIRATAGKNRIDKQFKNNWSKLSDSRIIRGAYHYYRPNENSIEQAENFIKTVKLRKGDLPPVLDIEQLPEEQSIDSLKVGLQRWLDRVEKHYKVKPIIYSGEKYYDNFLKDEFGDEYTFWIANYNFFVDEIQDDWLFWQFTERGTIPGIEGDVDVNIYNGSPKMLQYLTLSN
ncbi:MAG TPA: glycoside hydrolase family 25 protein [Flavobacterium sp.]|jgi:lysozyme